jgi:hypothetical protein
MALLKLYESANPVSIPFPVTGEDISGINTYSWYFRRYDCVVVWSNGFGGCFKLYRDGTCVRMCHGRLGVTVLMSYDANVDKGVSQLTTGTFIGGANNVYNDPIGMLWDPSKPATMTNPALPDAHWRNIVSGSSYYRSPIGGTATTRNNLTNGDTIETITFTGSQTFSADKFEMTDDGWMMLIDYTNGTRGVIRFKHRDTGEMWESTVDAAKCIWVDRVHNNIWVYRASDSKLLVYDMKVAPATISAPTMGANRSRYREDDIQVTVLGSESEPVRDWPIEWVMSDNVQGHLEFEVTRTDDSGIARNRWCGPGADDYLGGNLTITAQTAY